MIAKKAFSILASLGMALTVTVPAYAEETEIQAKGYTDVGYTVLDEWLGPTGTYPARHISGFDLTFAGEPEGVEPGDFTVIDEEYEAAGTFDNGVLTVSAAAAEGNTVKLTIPADKASTAMAYTGGLDFRRRKVSYTLSSTMISRQRTARSLPRPVISSRSHRMKSNRSVQEDLKNWS